MRHAKNPHPISPQPSGRRQFKLTCQSAIVGQQQQPLAGQVKPPHADHAWQLVLQFLEDGWPTLGILVRCHQAFRLVGTAKPGSGPADQPPFHAPAPRRRPTQKSPDASPSSRSAGSPPRPTSARHPAGWQPQRETATWRSGHPRCSSAALMPLAPLCRGGRNPPPTSIASTPA